MAENPDNQLGEEATQEVIGDTQPDEAAVAASIPPNQEASTPENGDLAAPHEGATCPYGSQPDSVVQQSPGAPSTPAMTDASLQVPLKSKPIEALSWEELKIQRQDYCCHCQEYVVGDPKQRVRKKGHADMSCRRCHNTVSMLYRKLNMKDVGGWAEMSTEDSVKFFQQAKTCLTPGGNLCYSKLKCLLSTSLAEQEIRRQVVAVRGKFQPLSVWATKGFDVKAIESKCEWRESAVFFGFSIYFQFLLCLCI